MFKAALLLSVLLFASADPALAAKVRVTPVNAPVASAPVAPAGEIVPPDAQAAEHHEEEAVHEEGSGGLPQMDISRFPGQIFWLTITFILTYLLMRHVALPGVEQTLGNREKRISSDMGGAKAKNEAAKHMMAEYETRLIKARADAQNATRVVTDESNAKSADVLKMQGDKVSAQIKSAETAINAQKQTAIAAIDQEVVSVISAILKSVADISPPANDIQAAIKKARGV